ncbi:mitochondrial inner-membrane-bound regulator, SLS-like protein [Phanerochaete sordida]|uniref:Mitochondrial inner-membrane-bound regulator, SLS-like protein n=1 Tax=Phanerochaete sordida TaxID=48140 RepID=A0A9P3G0A4_9APHY|nr:mitochondrial inner-membrane-bound regulator, SLS-like protein [Phanerochaete sordida]
MAESSGSAYAAETSNAQVRPATAEESLELNEELRALYKLEEAVAREVDPPVKKDPMEPTGVERYLARLQAEGVEPTLQDLDKCRPPRHPPKLSEQYIEKYHELVDVVGRTFSREQLQKFAKAAGLRGTSYKTKKIEYVEAIIEQRWGWPSLSTVEKEKRDRTEVVTESLPVNPSQLFLIMGKDGLDLLHLSIKYNVHISLIREPLALRIEGVRRSLRPLQEQIRTVIKNIVEDVVQLPTRTAIRPDLVQRISRLANAYMENIGDKGLVRICAHDSHSLGSAKRLASRASGEMVSASRTPLVVYLPAGVPLITDTPKEMSIYDYALYPFLSPRALPWYVNTAGAFRVRRVGEWLIGKNGEDTKKTGGLAVGTGHLLTLAGEPLDLRGALFNFDPTPGRRRTVKASTGHVLFNTPSKGQRATLLPPLKNSHNFAKILQWMSNNDQNTIRSSFVPGLPSSLVHSPPSEQKLVHRLIYKALPTSDSSAESADELLRRKMITFEVVLAQARAQMGGEDAESSSLSIEPRCEQGTESQLNLMMPDRTMDIRMSGLETELLPEESLPGELKQYIDDLREFLRVNGTQPDPPLTLMVDGDTYILYTSATVRQSIEQLMRYEDSSSTPFGVISESRLDLESGQRTTACEINCEDPKSELSWHDFLVGCDSLTSSNYRAPSPVYPEPQVDAETADLRAF